MDQFFEQLNQWGKDSVLQYGLTDTIIIILLILITAMVISRILTRLMKKRNFRNLPIWLKVKKYMIITITIYGILTLFIPAKTILDPLLASGGIVAVVVGLAAQETVGNLISGFMIVTFRPFHIGDLIRVNNGEYVGTVVEITIRHTIIETFENTRVIIPNSQMNTSVLENISDIGTAKADFLYVSVSYDTDLEQAVRVLQETVAAHPDYVDPRSEEEKQQGADQVVVRVTDFKDSGIELRATIYSNDNGTCFTMLSDLRIAVKKRFDQEGIEMPYPKQDLYIKEMIKNEDVQ
ncbi:MAG TPA: mechanosensitive ion channel family protein [Candidatus Merdibacter merdipullorum]|nr:mechanosensitive ion channel family protein [Candidatus Merdibacter merdipullorum]